MKRDSGVALGLAVGLACLSPSASAQVFKCKDADGKVTYTDVPCLRSETGSIVDTRANVADHSSIRREAGRLQSEPPPAPQGQSSPPAPPAPPPPAPSSVQRSNGYSR